MERKLTGLRLLPATEWPKGWSNPPELEWLAECELIDFSPWTICHGEWLVTVYRSIAQKYPTRTLIPIAKRGDNDATACWEVPGDDIVVIHWGADPGREDQARFDGFWPFLRSLLNDFVERGVEDTEYVRSKGLSWGDL